MKIRFWDRLILFLGALLTVAAGACLLIAGLQFLGAFGEGLPTAARAGFIAGGALLVIFGGFLLALPHKFAAGRHSFIVQQTDNGELRIAVKAIENLVQKCVDMHEEINLNSMHIRNGREGVTVDMNISLASNISIPLAVASLQKQIKQFLVASSGIEVKEVRVSVETTNGEAGEAPDSPYLVSQQEQEKEKEKPAPEASRPKPLHQRIFGRQEQEITVPEPPKAEEEAPAEAETPAPMEEPAEEETAQDAPAEEPLPREEAAQPADEPAPAEEEASAEQAEKENEQ